jgi:hypothetical protein
MKTIILQSNNEADLKIIADLLNRLNIYFVQTSKPIAISDWAVSDEEQAYLDMLYADDEPDSDEQSEEEATDNTALYEGLGLEKEIKFTSLEALKNRPDSALLASKYEPNFPRAKDFFGAWEEDEDETLEELLNMLTP